MRKMLRTDAFVGRNMPWFILAAVIAGVTLPRVFSPLHPYTMLMLAMLTLVNSLGGGFRDLAAVFKRPLPILVAFVVMHLIMPTVVLGIGRVLFPHDPDFVSGLVLQFTLPIGVASLMWVGMSGGHMGLCLSMVLLDTLLSPLSIPLVLQLLLGTSVEMDMLGMMKNLLLMVGVPALLGMTVYEVSRGQVAKTVKPMLSLPGKCIVMLISASTGSQCSDFFRNFNGWMMVVIATVVALTVMGFFVGHVTAQSMKMEFPEAFTLSLVIGFRNISAGIVLAQQYFPVAVLLPVSIVPLFQQLLMSVVIKLLWKTKSAKAYLAAQGTGQGT